MMELEELEKAVTQHGEQIKTLFAQLKEQCELIKSVNSLALSVRDLVNEQKNLRSDVDGMRQDVDELKSKPAKRWDGVIDKAIMIGVAAVMGFLLAKFGLQ